jgi:hypothetical protein
VRKSGAYPSKVNIKALGLIHIHSTRLKRLAMGKHSSLLRTFVNYGHNIFITLSPDLAYLATVAKKTGLMTLLPGSKPV